MKKGIIIAGGIAVIGLLFLLNSYEVISFGEGRTIAPLDAKIGAQETEDFSNNMPQPNQSQNPTAPSQPSQQVAANTPKTRINFAAPKKDFGKVLSTSSNEHTFVFTNTGTEPLVISNAKGSCGCTVPVWPKEAIMPGDEGEIKVVYKPNGQSGIQTKQVTVTANTDPANSFLTITGDIQPDPNAPKPQAISPEDAAAM